MAAIKINVSGVMNNSPSINNSIIKVSSAKNGISSLYWQIDNRIKSRRNIDSRLNNVIQSLENIESQMGQIKSVVENGAGQYHSTDKNILYNYGNMEKLVGFGRPIGFAGFFLNNVSINNTNNSALIKASTGNPVPVADKNNASLFSGKVENEGSILGIKVAGSAEGDLIGGSVETSAKAKFDLKEKEIGAELKAEAEGHVAKGKLAGNIGLLGGSVEGSVVNASASGSVGATLFSKGKFVPSLTAKAEAAVSVAKGEAEVVVGDDIFNANANASGSVLGAKAEAEAGVGKVSFENERGQDVTGYGVVGKVGAEAYAAEGEVSGGLTIFGVKIGASVEGKAGGAGVEAGGGITTGGIQGNIGVGLGLGAGVSISVDWSDFKLPELPFKLPWD